MAFCSNCGKALDEEVKFCSGCGVSIGNVQINQAMVDIYYNFVGVIEQEEHTTKQRVRQFQVFDPTLLAEYYKKSVAL